MGGRPGLPGCCLCWWDHTNSLLTNSLLSRGAQPDLHAPCCRFLPALSPKFYFFSEWTRRVNTFCVGGAKVPNKQMYPRSSSLLSVLHQPVTPTRVLSAVTPHATEGAGLSVLTRSGSAGNLCTLSTQAKASQSRDTARKGSATLLLLQGGGTTLMPCAHSGGPQPYVRLVCSASQTPKSLLSKEPYTHTPSRSDG